MLVAHPIFHEELSDMFIKVKEAIELQNKTSLASIPTSGVRAVVFMTQVPPVSSPVNPCCAPTSAPFLKNPGSCPFHLLFA